MKSELLNFSRWPLHIRRWVAFLLILSAGCSTLKQPDVGSGVIHVPKMFRPSLGWLGTATTDYEFYLEAYRTGYWDCIEHYIDNINYISTKSDYNNQCGWMSQIMGYHDGYAAAEKDMQRNIKRFGKAITTEYLKKIADGP